MYRDSAFVRLSFPVSGFLNKNIVIKLDLQDTCSCAFARTLRMDIAAHNTAAFCLLFLP